MDIYTSITRPLIGGALIGIAASLLLLFNGRVFGISGILAGVVMPRRGETSWRLSVLVGLLSAGALLAMVAPASVRIATSGPLWRYVLAGLLVGFGTQLGSGCTSGHGVCGLSRLSRRSLVATVTFINAGILAVALMRLMGIPL